jgi:hypothetical protein
MAWFITRQTTAEYQAVYISGVPGMDEEEVERELQNLARLQAIEAAATQLVEDCGWNISAIEQLGEYDIAGHLLKELAAALDRKPAPADHGSIHNPDDYEY